MLFVLKVIFWNIVTFFVNIFIWRDKKIWLIGTWSGKTFTDNSRFLYQHLYEHKEKYHINKLIWFTRDREIYDLMKSLGYNDVLLDGSKGCFYYHIKSGVHIICNSIGDVNRLGDINTFLSLGAKKLQMWHGVSIKACAFLRREKRSGLKNYFSRNIINRLFKPGMWGRCYQLATSEENKRTTIEDFAVIPNRVIVAAYPRDCVCPQLLPFEQQIISSIKEIKKTKRIIAYLPTFRKELHGFVSPAEIPGFINFLTVNGFVWLQKTHMADNNVSFNENNKSVLSLPSDFDINVLYEYIDLLITDYSSTATDIMNYNKRILNYCPDFEYYKNQDRGFVNDFETYFVGKFVSNPELLFNKILECINEENYLNDGYYKTKHFLLGDKKWTLDEITLEIKKQMRI